MTTSPKRVGLPVVLSLFAVVVGCGGEGKGARSAADESSGGKGHAEVGRPAPDLSIQTLNKGKFSLESMRGKAVIVDFWATWCGPCRQSFPKLEELSKRLGDKVEVIGISVDDDPKGVLEFARENGATFTIAWDEGHTIASRWKVGTMPTTFIVDGTGKVRFIHDGYHDGETKVMEREIASFAGEGSSAVAKTEDKKDDEKKEDEKKDEKKAELMASAAPSAASSDDEKVEAPPPKKKGAKKGGKKGAAKKNSKKKT